jgi:hypothetical protein
MQYALTIYGEPRELSPEDGQAMTAEYMRVTEEMRAAGAFLAGEGLQPVSTATTVRVPNGERIVTDGPFAETREQLGGYYLVEAKDLDEALGIAARIPTAKVGSIEVRPIMVYD